MNNSCINQTANGYVKHNCNENQKNRILLVWDTSVWSTIVMHTNKQCITCSLHNATGLCIICTVMYAFNIREQRVNPWHYLIHQASLFNLPWIILGDFNTILSSQERINQGIYCKLGDTDFMNCINNSKFVN